MKIPLAYSDVGYVYPLGEGFYFLLKVSQYKKCELPEMTWKEFKEAYPVELHYSSRFRRKPKKKRIRCTKDGKVAEVWIEYGKNETKIKALSDGKGNAYHLIFKEHRKVLMFEHLIIEPDTYDYIEHV